MAHIHDVYDTGKHFEINGISRFIKETSTTKLVLVQGDHKSEVVTFKMPRYIDGHDMLLCNKIRVHYINIETKTNNTSADIYEVTDLKLCKDCEEEEEESIVFTWTIEAPATKYFGSLSFLIKFECTEGENILYQWNTARYVNVNVLNGIDNSEAFVDKYSNVLEEWYNKLMGESETVANLVETVGQQLEDCEQATTNATKATNSCAEATENCISATEDAEAVRAEVEAGGFIESLKELNNGDKFTFWIGTQVEYDAISEKIKDCFYIITDDTARSDIVATALNTMSDYPIESGYADGWFWEKWNSGKLVQWGRFESQEVCSYDQTGATCSITSFFPIEFVGNHPVLTASGMQLGAYNSQLMMVAGDNKTASAYLKCPHSISEQPCYFQFRAVGRWK